MRPRRPTMVAALAGTVATARPVAAQLAPTTVELYGSGGGVVGATPVRPLDASHLGIHGGFRFDGGIQGERLGLGVGLRVRELLPTQTFGGHGLDGFLEAEWRASAEARTTLHATAGAGFDELDPGRGPDREHTGTQGLLRSVGVGRELTAPSGANVLRSADLVMPHVNPDVDGRRRPILELGFAYRSRFLQRIAMPAL